ncbi:MAG TPA: hypothetical protein PKE39_09260 [Ignavibacteria bacterium]|nr:hypothetical protein [Ignavibacteria bacterium]HMQ99199.1 hypothetical protein [Ignavibacteria bacterium]
MRRIEICPLTGLQINNEDIVPHIENQFLFEYKNRILGGVIFTEQSYLAVENLEDYEVKSIIIGICRNHFEKYKKGFEVKYDFVKNGYKDFEYPKNFKEKSLKFMNYLYENGGDEYKSFTIRPTIDFPLAYALNGDEFTRILTKLDREYILEVKDIQYAAGGMNVYCEVLFTSNGISEIEKDKPVVPMVGLVDQDVRTGDTSIDDKINHAKKLFFKSNSNFDDKRSACETLSYVLEPLREELKHYFSNPDVNDFFRMVNDFDIRHNKEHTKDIKTEEQLEWVFYALLNTISCFVKIKNKNL